jgi:hypothetical protein
MPSSNSVLNIFFVALEAVTFDGEGRISIVARSAGSAAFHRFHCCPFTISVGEKLGMAVVAAVGSRVKLMAEMADNGAIFAFKG